MWRWLRRIFLLFLWLEVALGLALTVWGWRVVPARVLGVAWPWFSGSFLLALAVMALNAMLELPEYPLPPEVPPGTEMRRWLFYWGLGGLTAAVFTLLVSLPILFVHSLRVWAEGRGVWVRRALVPVGGVGLVAWFMGVFFVLGWLQEQPCITRLRRWMTRLQTPTARDIRFMLQRVPLPLEVKQRFLARLEREGMTPALARELQSVLGPYVETQEDLRDRGRYAVLYQALSAWLEVHQGG